LLMLAFFHIVLANSGVEKKTAGFDFFFILIFSSLLMVWLKPQDFQMNKISGNIVASPSLFMLSHLAVNKDVIINSRFIIHFVYTFPFQFLLLLGLYLLTPTLQSALNISAYIAFCIIWLSFGFYAGYLFFAGDAGGKNKGGPATAALIFLFSAV